jgi:hypothetical protein
MSATPDLQTLLNQGARIPGAALGLLSRMRGMLLTPKAEWALIAAESTSPRRIYAGFVLPLAAMAAGIALAHVSLVGRTEPLIGTVRAPLLVGLKTAGLVFGCALLGIFLTALVIGALGPYFGASRNSRLACAIAAYASTPVWIATVFVSFPTLWPFLYVLALIYHTYLLYLGLSLLLNAPRDKVLGYATTIILCTILMEIVFTMASFGLGGATHMNPYRAFG